MVCPNCGKDCGSANFCSQCGQNLQDTEKRTKELETYVPLQEPFIKEISGKKIDLHKVVRIYGTGWRKNGAYAYLVSECGISFAQAKQILDPIYANHEGEKVSFINSLSAEADSKSEEASREKKAREQKQSELKASGQAYCPKCWSTSVSAQKKGFSVGQALLGGPLAGAIGSNKIQCVCLKCGHRWNPGK